MVGATVVSKNNNHRIRDFSESWDKRQGTAEASLNMANQWPCLKEMCYNENVKRGSELLSLQSV